MPFHDYYGNVWYGNVPRMQQGGLTCKPNLDLIFETIQIKLARDIDFRKKKDPKLYSNNLFHHLQEIIQAAVDESLHQTGGYLCELILENFVKQWNDFCKTSKKISFENFMEEQAFYLKSRNEYDNEKENKTKILKRIKTWTRSFANGMRLSTARIHSRFGNQAAKNKQRPTCQSTDRQ